MWLKICTDETHTSTIIVATDSQSIFPAGWCNANKYSLTTPSTHLLQYECVTKASGIYSLSSSSNNIRRKLLIQHHKRKQKKQKSTR